MAEGGPDGGTSGMAMLIQYIVRPANLIGVNGAYAVYIRGPVWSSLYQGELAHIHPASP